MALTRSVEGVVAVTLPRTLRALRPMTLTDMWNVHSSANKSCLEHHAMLIATLRDEVPITLDTQTLATNLTQNAE
jgi:hypothetical protein